MTSQHFNDSKLRDFLNWRQFLWNNNPSRADFPQICLVPSLVPTTSLGEELHGAATCYPNGHLLFGSKPGFSQLLLFLLHSCSWEKSVSLFLSTLPMLLNILQIFTTFFQLFLLWVISLTLVQRLFHTFDYSHCFSLRLFQFFCIIWDDWQERTAENSRCGITIDLCSFIIMFWFVFYFLPNIS